MTRGSSVGKTGDVAATALFDGAAAKADAVPRGAHKLNSPFLQRKTETTAV